MLAEDFLTQGGQRSAPTQTDWLLYAQALLGSNAFIFVD